MAHGYRVLQHWNQWLSQQELGRTLLDAERQLVTRLLTNHFGKHALLIGVPHQAHLLSAVAIPCQSLVSPILFKEHVAKFIEGDFHELPILTGSIDLVVIPHTLEFIDNPRQLLAEACRVVKPEGLIVISGFNPYSAWGLRKILGKHKAAPWTGNFMPASKIKSWLRLADFELEQQKSVLFTPPIKNKNVFDKLHLFEQFGNAYLPFLSGAYVLVARAKVIPLTPIKLKWKQQLNGIRISTSITGHVAQESGQFK